ncbi:MAG: 50S ribosomal protein L22 [Candidatus Kerfeldbacteria bacterium]|nr:50S ribosomal protein L22 [Candidatus Kerfeldbacteria bacterium]
MTKPVTAHLRFLRIAPRKVRLVLDLIRGKSLDVAEQQLMALPKGSSQPILKLLKSAQANADHNFKLDPKLLYVSQAYANEGPKLKRYMPHAMGRATVILKRMSHVTVALSPISEMPKPKRKGQRPAAPAPKPATKPAKKSAAPKPAAVKEKK